MNIKPAMYAIERDRNYFIYCVSTYPGGGARGWYTDGSGVEHWVEQAEKRDDIVEMHIIRLEHTYSYTPE